MTRGRVKVEIINHTKRFAIKRGGKFPVTKKLYGLSFANQNRLSVLMIYNFHF
jgi:hypothetical protein